MRRGAFSTVACGGLALAACSTPGVRVRAIADPAAKLRGSGDALAEARNMLALNSVGLALEGFRRLEIEQPSNPDVYVGLAQCYAAMGRYDLEGSNYEKALAYAPHQASILAAYASSLERQGEPHRAAEVRTELALAVAPAMQAPQTGTLTIKLPPARAVSRTVAQPITPKSPVVAKEEARTSAPALSSPMLLIAARAAEIKLVVRPLQTLRDRSSREFFNPVLVLPLPDPAPAAIKLFPASSIKPQVTAVTLPVRQSLRFRPLPFVAPNSAAAMASTTASVVTDKSKVPMKVAPDAATLAARLAAMEPLLKPRDLVHSTEQRDAIQNPRLERLSIGEVALVTTQAPVWKTQTASATRPHIATQWLPIRTAEGRPAIQLLNAARSQGLAARTREALADRGWRRMRIGDYREVRQRSVVLYSSEHAPMGRRLAAQFNCKAIEVHGRSVLVVLLGRDAAWRRGGSSRA